MMIVVFCFGDEWLKGRKLRQRDPQPTLSDSEELTTNIVGEFLGTDAKKDLRAYFRRHYTEWFSALGQIPTPPSAVRAANRWILDKNRIWQHLLSRTRFDPTLSLVDS